MATAKAATVPAPVGGWNARDAWAAMKNTDAVLMDNWYPSAGEVISRKGCAQYTTTLGASVESLMVYNDGGSPKMLAGADGEIWNVSTSTPSSLHNTGITLNQWQHATLDGMMGLVNGTDSPLKFNGTAISAMTLTGPTAANVIGVYAFKNRSYFWEDGSQSFWYSALNTMGGTLTEFDLGKLGNGISGKLMTMVSWTRDGGDGMDDFAVFLFSDGSCVIYQGSDPGDANAWALVGVYRVAPPVGRRCTLNYGGDVIVITRDGYVSLAETIVKRSASVSDKIRDAVKNAVALYGGNTGWSITAYDSGGFVVINVPTTTTESVQHIMNLQTRAWCRFTGWNARSWAVFDNQLYFGAADGRIFKAWTGTSDNGDAIPLDCVPAFSYFGSANLKQITAIQPSLKTNGTLNLGLVTERDFEIRARPTPDVSIGESSSPWGSPWGSPWSRSAMLSVPFKTATKVGRALTGRMVANVTNHNLSWYATTYFYKTGGFV